MQTKLKIKFFKSIILVPLSILIFESSLIKIAKSEDLKFSEDALRIFGRYDFQYNKYREHVQKYKQSNNLEDLALSCQYAKRANKILVNNYAQLTSETGPIWDKYRVMWKQIIMICNQNDW